MTPLGMASAHVDVPLDQTEAFETFTAEIGDWFVVNQFTVPDHTEVQTVRLEPHVGGRLIYVKTVDGGGTTAGRVTTWEPPHRFSFVDSRDLEVTVTFTALEHGCRVTVEEVGFDKLEPELARRVRRHSWHRHLPEWFKHYTKKGSTER